ncbi:MAG: class I SAM-dependent methyltransferase [Myxococcota bacterium]
MSLKRPQAYYDEFSKTYDDGRDDGYHLLVDELESAIVQRHVRAGGRVLEIGCGTGLILERLVRHGRAIGVDLSRGMLLRAHARGLTVVQASATALPFRDGAFDTACSFKVLAHVERIRDATAEVARVLRSGGHAALEFYNRLSLRYLTFRLRRGAISQHTTEKDVYVRYDRLADMRAYFPPAMRIVDLHGVRVVTPHAALLRAPLLRGLLGALERRCADAPVVRRLGGFLVLVARRE